MSDETHIQEGNNLMQVKEVREHLEHLRRAHARMLGLPQPPLRSRRERIMRANQANLRKPGTPKRISTTIRLQPEVLEAFKAEGQGWQTRINEALLEYVEQYLAGQGK